MGARVNFRSMSSSAPQDAESGWRRLGIAAFIACTLLLAAKPVQAGELRVEGTGSLALSQWRTDRLIHGSLKLGYRFIDLVGIYGSGRLGYGSVDRRMLTQISMGAQLWGKLGPLRPWIRLGLLHQHEESVSVIANDFGKALFGIGDGIRHRAGGEASVGSDLTLFEKDKLSIFGLGQVYMSFVPDDLGPRYYLGGGFGLGVNFQL
jgi:hypothetical protein